MCFISVCDQLAKHIIAIFGPVNHDIATFTGSACSSLQIPHIETRVDTSVLPLSPFSVNLHPDSEQLSRAIIDVIRHFGWTDILILYSNHVGKTFISLSLAVYCNLLQAKSNIPLRYVRR